MNVGTRLLVEKIRELAAEGKTRMEAAVEVGCVYQTIVNHALKHGITFKRQPGRGSPETERNIEILRRREAGEILQAIADDYGITRERVRQIEAKSGAKSATEKSRERDALIIAEIKAGLMTKEVAEKFGMKQSTVWNVCHRHGVSPSRISAERLVGFERGAELVRGGMSMCKAEKAVGLPLNRLYKYCKKHGVFSQHKSRNPRYRDRAIGMEASA